MKLCQTHFLSGQAIFALPPSHLERARHSEMALKLARCFCKAMAASYTQEWEAWLLRILANTYNVLFTLANYEHKGKSHRGVAGHFLWCRSML